MKSFEAGLSKRPKLQNNIYVSTWCTSKPKFGWQLKMVGQPEKQSTVSIGQVEHFKETHKSMPSPYAC